MTDHRPPTNHWRKWLLLAAAFVVILLLAPHPELRLLLPFIDAVGIDLFVVLVASQAWSYFKPLLHRLYRSLVLPVLQALYALVVYFLYIAGPYFDAQVASRFPNCELRSNNSFKPTLLRKAA